MYSVREIIMVLPSLSTDELQYIERVIHNLYRVRCESIVYDDDYGIWTDQDQVSVASEIFKLLDEEEDLK